MRLAHARRLALLLTGLTGFAGLVYEVAWERLLATLLGSHSAATATVLALFLGGLAAGYALFGRLSLDLASGDGRPASARRGRLLVVYGGLEMGVGLHALAFVPLLDAARAASLWIPVPLGALAFCVDVGLAALVALPGAVLMGGTIPFLTQALARGSDDATRVHAQIYATNTFGALVGALAAGLWLVDRLGLAGVLHAMALLNLAAGLAFVVLGRRLRRVAEARAPLPIVGAMERRSLRLRLPQLDVFSAIALLAGFAMMALQTVMIRLGALALGASQLTFALVVATFIACLAAGSFLVAALPRVGGTLLPLCLWAMVAVLTALFALLENVTWAAHALRSLFGDEPSQLTAFALATFVALLLLLAPALLLSGATLPLLFHHVRRRSADLGARAGALYGWNTTGSLLGALLGGYLLLYWIELHHVYRLAVLALALAALLASLRVLDRARRASVAAFAATLVALALLPAWSPDRLAAGLFRERAALPHTFDGPGAFFAANPRGKILFHVDDPTATITVKQGVRPDGRPDLAIVTNGKSDGFVIGERKTTGLLALVPALLAQRVERAFVIGYGTGVSAGELAALDETREVVVAEIARGVIDAAPWFDWSNGGASQHPEIHVQERDAYRALLRAGEPFDVIVSEPSNPWVSGVEMLYSVEFLRAARDALRPGGVHAQWFHLYDLDSATVALILRSYASVFDEVAVWFTLDADLLLLGLVGDPAAALDLARLHARAQRPDFAAGLLRSGIDSFAALLAHELLPLGVLHDLGLEGPLHTLYHPRLGHAAARAFFARAAGELPNRVSAAALRSGADRSLLRRYAASRPGGLPERDWEAVARETCGQRPRECATWLAAWQHAQPRSPAREALLAEGRVPARIQGAEIRFVLDTLARLYDGAASTQDDDPLRAAGDAGDDPLRASGDAVDDPLRAAGDATRRFVNFYHHAAPFDPAALERAWQQCASSPAAERCAAPQREALALVGVFGPSLAER